MKTYLPRMYSILLKLFIKYWLLLQQLLPIKKGTLQDGTNELLNKINNADKDNWLFCYHSPKFPIYALIECGNVAIVWWEVELSLWKMVQNDITISDSEKVFGKTSVKNREKICHESEIFICQNKRNGRKIH